jgi:predicted ATPase with chaperone activity
MSTERQGADATVVRFDAHPKAPRTMRDTGLEEGFLIDLLVKVIYRIGLERASEFSQVTKLSVAIIEEMLRLGQELKLVETLGQRGASMTAEMRYALSGLGRSRALEAMAKSEYAGPAPVPLANFVAQANAQSIRGEVLSRAMLEKVFAKLTLADELMAKIGPAVNSGQSIMLYGPAGNGKSSIAIAVTMAYQDQVYLPYCFEVDNQVITLYDPTVHHRLDKDDYDNEGLRRGGSFDKRYVLCQRPAVVTGGELTLDALNLAYNPTSRIYEAPMQLKAVGGVFVIDDFGRQRHTPQEMINRLIIPLEVKVDYLTLQTGRKFEVPFDPLVIFSTNIPPATLADEAALRRLRYKIEVGPPSKELYIKIFARCAREYGLELTEEILAHLLLELYPNQPGAEFHAFHPRFLIEQTVAICTYEGARPELRKDFLDRAWINLFAKD